MIRGTVRHQPMLPPRRVWDFKTPVDLVRWYLSFGPGGVRELKAVNYETVRIKRDAYSREALMERFTFAVKAFSVVSEQEDGILRLAYVAGKSDLQIAERLDTARRTVSRIRTRALRKIKERAQELELMAGDDVDDGSIR